MTRRRWLATLIAIPIAIFTRAGTTKLHGHSKDLPITDEQLFNGYMQHRWEFGDAARLKQDKTKDLNDLWFKKY